MTLLYADTSALVRAYFVDEPDHERLRTRLIDGDEPVVTSELTRIEFASAVWAASRGGRLRDAQLVLDRFDGDCSDDGPLTLLRLDPESCVPLAYRLVGEHRLRTLDALHVAVALTDATELAAGEPVTLVTRDQAQAAAADALGLAVG
jgi:predicted nucleic acid-binding protein